MKKSKNILTHIIYKSLISLLFLMQTTSLLAQLQYNTDNYYLTTPEKTTLQKQKEEYLSIMLGPSFHFVNLEYSTNLYSSSNSWGVYISAAYHIHLKYFNIIAQGEYQIHNLNLDTSVLPYSPQISHALNIIGIIAIPLFQNIQLGVAPVITLHTKNPTRVIKADLSALITCIYTNKLTEYLNLLISIGFQYNFTNNLWKSISQQTREFDLIGKIGIQKAVKLFL